MKDSEDTVYSAADCQPTLSYTYWKLLALNNKEAARCNFISNNLEKVTDINDGIVIINDVIGERKKLSETLRTVNGPFLITFRENVTIQVTLYVKKTNIEILGPPPSHQLLLRIAPKS